MTEFMTNFTTLRAIVDIAFVFVIVYVILKLLRGTRAVPTVAGIGVLALLYWLSISQELPTLQFVLREAIFYIGILIIVLFQSEIRQALIYFGNRIQLPLLRRKQTAKEKSVYDNIILAVTTLSSTKTGGLVVFERAIGLRNFIDTGVELDAVMNYDLIVTIFNPSTPLHDGAIIIRDQRIAAASCFLPLTKNPNVSRNFGTRHRAAIGITEGSDAVAVVVSEETGSISFVEQGRLIRNLDSKKLRKLLDQSMDIGWELKGSLNETEDDSSVVSRKRRSDAEQEAIVS